MGAIDVNLNEIYFDEATNYLRPKPISLDWLIESIKKDKLFNPIILKESGKEGYKYEIVAGNQRYKAYRLLNEKTIKAFIVNNDSDSFITIKC